MTGRSCSESTSRASRQPSGMAMGRGGRRWRQWRRQDCHQEKGCGAQGRHGALRPHDVDGSRLHRLAHQPARMQDLMCSNFERNFGMSMSLGDAIISCHVLQWGVKSDYAGAPYNIVVGAAVVLLPYNPVALARTFHTLSGPRTSVYVLGLAQLAGPHVAFKGEIVRLFARVPRLDGPRSWLRSPGVFIICHMDGKMAAQLRWVTMVQQGW
jgi:hypothetical protein